MTWLNQCDQLDHPIDNNKIEWMSDFTSFTIIFWLYYVHQFIKTFPKILSASLTLANELMSKQRLHFNYPECPSLIILLLMKELRVEWQDKTMNTWSKVEEGELKRGKYYDILVGLFLKVSRIKQAPIIIMDWKRNALCFTSIQFKLWTYSLFHFNPPAMWLNLTTSLLSNLLK